MSVVYVLNRQGKPLMPTVRCGHVRYLLKNKLAKVVERVPFTIRLLYDVDDITQALMLGMRPGRRQLNVCVVNGNAEPVMAAAVTTRNKDIKSLIIKRSINRRNHRDKNRRRKRQRRAIRNNTIIQTGFVLRTLPHYKKPIKCKYIRNKQARFCNRKRDPDWLTPTAEHLAQTHINAVHLICKYLPVTHVIVETNKYFCFRFSNPVINGLNDNNCGHMGTEFVERSVFAMQNNRCAVCGNHIDYIYHMKSQTKNGKTVANRCGLCVSCYERIKKNDKTFDLMLSKLAKLGDDYNKLGVVEQMFPKFMYHMIGQFPGHVYLTTAKETFLFNQEHGHVDKNNRNLAAYAAACFLITDSAEFKFPEKVYFINQYRRHDRQACHQQNNKRKYVDKNGRVVALNRKRAFRQAERGLDEYVAIGGSTADIRVIKHASIYKNKSRIMPGAVFMVNKKRKVMNGSVGYHNGKPDQYVFSDETKCSPRRAKLVKKNSGLVFV